jgi:hypothetical protein
MRRCLLVFLSSLALSAAEPGAAAPSPELETVRARVAALRRQLGSRAGEPEVPDKFIAIPADAAWLTSAEAQRGFAAALPRLEKLTWWRPGLDPTRLTHPLREPAAVISGCVEACRARLDGADRALALAKAAAEFLLWAQAEAGTGVFPFPAVRGHGSNAAFAAADRYLQRAAETGTLEKVVRHGWIIDDGSDGGLQFDHAEAGVALLDLATVADDPRYLASARKAADWAVTRPIVPNWNYNSFSVHLLARAFAATQEPRYLAAAKQKALLGVLPGQLIDGPHAGRWLDPHNARPAYHYIMMRALTALATVLPKDDPARPEILQALQRGLRARNEDFLGPGAPNKDKAMEALILVQRTFADDAAFLRASRTTAALEALGRLVSAEFRRGAAPLGPREWPLFLAYACERSFPRPP